MKGPPAAGAVRGPRHRQQRRDDGARALVPVVRPGRAASWCRQAPSGMPRPSCSRGLSLTPRQQLAAWLRESATVAAEVPSGGERLAPSRSHRPAVPGRPGGRRARRRGQGAEGAFGPRALQAAEVARQVHARRPDLGSQGRQSPAAGGADLDAPLPLDQRPRQGDRGLGLRDAPRGKPPKHGWPVVSWAHGTTGIADACAPSRDPKGPYTFYAAKQFGAWLKAGYAVANTDYEGLGTPGVHPVPGGSL